MGHIRPPLLCDRATTTMDAASDGARQRYPGDEAQITLIANASSGFQHLVGKRLPACMARTLHEKPVSFLH